MKKVKKAKKVKKTKKVTKKKKVAKPRQIRKPKRLKKLKTVRRKKISKPAKVTKKKIVEKSVKVPKPKKVEEAPRPAQKVTYTQENAMLCICTKCPIQAESKCAGEKVGHMEAMMARGMPEGMMPPSADLPGLYCATGFATCKDLDFSKMCMCGGCSVWEKYKLASGKPMGYFCRDGKAV
ncbi:MAG: hypothetical protein OEV79_12360 [candidate division WOR-3 bacterium]|nr:hypothetical protein [candidate division WOR-3 bacterium]